MKTGPRPTRTAWWLWFLRLAREVYQLTGEEWLRLGHQFLEYGKTERWMMPEVTALRSAYANNVHPADAVAHIAGRYHWPKESDGI